MTPPLLLFGDHLQASVIAASDQVPTLPAAHLRHPTVAKRWQCPGTAGWITADAGQAVPARGIVLAGCHIGPADRIRWRLSTGAAAAGDVIDTGWIAQPGVALEGYAAVLFAGPVTARFLRIDIDAPGRAAFGWFGLGRLFWADGWQPRFGAAPGLIEDATDPSPIHRAPVSGAEYPARRPVQRTLSLSFEALDAVPGADRRALRRLRRAAGITEQVVLVPDPDSPDLAEEIVLGRLDAPPAITRANTAFDTTRLSIRESR